jgi:hypothetical protein
MTDSLVLSGKRDSWRLWKTEQKFELWAHVSDRNKLRNELIAEFKERPSRKEVVRRWLEEINFRHRLRNG